MTMLSTTETVMRSASDALTTWFALDRTPPSGTKRGVLEAEQTTIATAITALVARMDDDDVDAELLDDLTEQTAALLGRAEEIRLALALADRAAADTWVVSLDLD
jgi:hypothetical protein